MTGPVRKAYRFLSGKDEAAFCQRVSDALAEGYELYGNPVMVMDGDQRIVGQAVIDPAQVDCGGRTGSEKQA